MSAQHKSPLPLISRQSTNRKIAQNIVDCISNKGAYFQHSSIEDPAHVISSIDQVRNAIQREVRNIDSLTTSILSFASAYQLLPFLHAGSIPTCNLCLRRVTVLTLPTTVLLV